jgi:nicotinamide phosphoribosyltransferase
VATLSRSVKEVIAHAIEQDGGDPGGLNFMLQDFGYRGAAMNEASRAGGAAHLVNFQGTDTLGGMALALDYYEAIPASLGFSVPASEHSVMTSLGREGEYEMLDRLLDKFPTGILSVVADSYDIYAFTEAVIARKDRIMARDGVFVLRPDSTTDQHRTPHGLTAHLAQMLWDGFGGTETEKGYRLLDEHVRLLWGDGIDAQGIASILNKLHLHNFAAGNIGCFGMGGGLLQKVNRDTQRFAFKCSAQHRDGVWHDVRKDPLDASKLSKAGRLKLVNDPAVGLITVREDDVQYAGQPDVLQVVFENGEVFTEGNSFDEIRERADA